MVLNLPGVQLRFTATKASGQVSFDFAAAMKMRPSLALQKASKLHSSHSGLADSVPKAVLAGAAYNPKMPAIAMSP